MLHRRFHPLIALIALAMLCSLLVTQRSAVYAQRAATSAPQASADSIELISSIGGVVAVLDVEGSLAYINEGGALAIVDAADPAQPIRRGYLPLPDSPISIDVVGTNAYIAAAEAGLQIVDVHDPARPALRATYAVDIEALGIASDGNLLFMVDSFAATLHIADITYPFNPRPRASYRLPDGYPWDVDVVNDLVFVNTRGLGLRLLRVHPERFPSDIFVPLVGKTS